MYSEAQQVEFRCEVKRAILMANAGEVEKAIDIMEALPEPVQDQMVEVLESFHAAKNQ